MRLMIFAQHPGGHHPDHVAILVDQWSRGAWAGEIDVVASPRFAARHDDVMKQIGVARAATRWTVPADLDPGRDIADTLPGGTPKSGIEQWATAWWDLIADLARRRGADHVLFLNLDVLAAIAALDRDVGAFSGIVVRPPHDATSPRWRDLGRALRHPRLDTLFFHDLSTAPTVVRESGRVVGLDVPVRRPEAMPDRAAARAALAIEPARRVVLFFGHADRRKGIWQAIQALALLPPALARELAFVVAGEPDVGIVDIVVAGLAALREHGVQIVTEFGFVPEARVTPLFTAADVVLAPHQNHPGMSGVMLLAAAHDRPIVTQAFGTIGSLTRENALGLAIDTTQPMLIASALRQILAGSPAFDPARARDFAARHDPARFAAAIFDRLFGRRS